MSTTIRVDLPVDLNTMDDTGMPWAFLDRAAHPERIKVGRYIVVGSGAALAVAQVADIDGDVVHVRPLRGSVARNAHLLDPRRLAS